MHIVPRFLADRRGAVAAMAAVMASVLVGFGGLAAETAFWYAQKRALQTQADAAALSGAYELLQGNSANAATWASRDAVLNGFDNTSPNTISTSCSGTSCQVTLTLQHNTALASAFLPTVTIKAQAKAELQVQDASANKYPSVACLIALTNSTSTAAVILTPQIRLPNCTIAIPNQTIRQSAGATRGGSVTIDAIWSRGGYNKDAATFTMNRPPITFGGSTSYQPSDPYSSSAPTFTVPAGAAQNKPSCAHGAASWSPGKYNPVSIASGESCDLLPGVYYFVGADATGAAFKAANGARITCARCGCNSGPGTGVTFIFVPSGIPITAGALSLTGSASLTLCGPSNAQAGTTNTAGLLFYQGDSGTKSSNCSAGVIYKSHSISARGSGQITGIAYFPCSSALPGVTFSQPAFGFDCFITIAQSITASGLRNDSSYNSCINDGIPVGLPGSGKGAQQVYRVVMTQ